MRQTYGSGDAEVLIIGAGIAGCCAAYYAARRGLRCMVIDSGIDCASTVPTALINPIRGYRARSSMEGIDGARFTFELIEHLRGAGHAVRSGRGLWRPIPDTEQRDQWASLLPPDLRYSWRDGEPLKKVLRGSWVATLFLPDSGWVETASLLAALREASQAEFASANVVSVAPSNRSVVLEDGRTIRSRTLLWCGGALGASRIAGAARFRPGSVLLARPPIFEGAISYGLYTAPHGSGCVIGSTTEPQYANYPSAWEGRRPLQELVDRARSVFQEDIVAVGDWRGVRLESAVLPKGLNTLGPFGSRGYLLAPQAAHLWAEQL